MKSVFKNLRAAFAAATLSFAAVPALAQEAPAAPATPVAAATPAVSTALPDISNFNVRSFYLGDGQGALYLCGDNTQSCWTQAEIEAGAVREFQMMMMSTAFGCRYKEGMHDLLDYYNTFVVNNRDTLAAGYHLVGSRFAALAPTPRAAMRAQDSLDTENANIYAGAATRDGFCETSAQILRHVSTIQDDAEMVRLAHRIILPARTAPVATPAPAAPQGPGV